MTVFCASKMATSVKTLFSNIYKLRISILVIFVVFLIVIYIALGITGSVYYFFGFEDKAHLNTVQNYKLNNGETIKGYLDNLHANDQDIETSEWKGNEWGACKYIKRKKSGRIISYCFDELNSGKGIRFHKKVDRNIVFPKDDTEAAELFPEFQR